ncbi:MAG: hypothetical protein IKR18_10980 [Bacteroidaceae bacterium]|nr:hypothetical protein [Bacteroidaceae bacterium]
MKALRTFLTAALAAMACTASAQTGGVATVMTDSVGTYRFTNGDVYTGGFKAGRFNGKGTYTYASGQKYVGEWKNGNMDGKGVFTWPNGNRYEGDFVAGVRQGQGTFYYASGDTFSGEWRGGTKDGRGTYTYADGTKESGVWKGNDLIEPDKAATIAAGPTAVASNVTTDAQPSSQAPAAVTKEQSSTTQITLNEAEELDLMTAYTTRETTLLKSPEKGAQQLCWVPELGRMALRRSAVGQDYTEVMFIDRNMNGYVENSAIGFRKPVEPKSARAKSVGSAASELTADVTIVNNRKIALTVWFGKQKYTLKPQQKTLLGNMVPGTYTTRIYGRGITPEISNETLESGKKYEIEF